MAFTVSQIANSVMGNKRINFIKVTADAAEANLSLGFNNIDFVSCQPQLGQTMPAAHLNANSSGTASQGNLGVSGTSSANIFHVMVVGS